MRCLPRTALRRRSRRGGAGLLFFVLVAVPTLFFTAALSVDTTFQIIAVNQVTAATDAAARAGALRQLPNVAELDQVNASAVARDTFNTAWNRGVMSMVTKPDIVVETDTQTVSVSAVFKTRLRTFVRAVTGGGGEEITIRRTARLCRPNDASLATDGFCGVPYAS